MAKFAGLNAQVLGISVDSVPCLEAWAESLGGISYPLLSDFWPHGGVAKKYGVLRKEGKTERAIFIVDREGAVRYVDVHDIDEQPDNEVVLQELRRIDPAAAEHERSWLREQEEPLPRGGVVMYCTPWCPDCRVARNWLTERGIEFQEIDVNSSPRAAKQVREWANGRLITPTFDVHGTVVVDFDRGKLEELLGQRRSA